MQGFRGLAVAYPVVVLAIDIEPHAMKRLGFRVAGVGHRG